MALLIGYPDLGTAHQIGEADVNIILLSAGGLPMRFWGSKSRGGGAKKIVGAEGSEGESRIQVEGGVLLGGESSQKL